jgi:DNA-binding PucR family transcriptional regulator
VNAQDLEIAGANLERKSDRVRDGVEAAAMCTALAIVTAPFTLTLALALLVGAVAAGLIAIANKLSRQETVARLALDPDAYILTDVRHYGEHLVSPAERQKLAEWLHEIASDTRASASLYLDDRVLRHAGLLESLARELSAPGAHVRPSSAAACRHLLTHAESALYNPAVSPEALPLTIERIRRGIKQ